MELFESLRSRATMDLKPYELDYNDLVFDHLIGVGSFGEVWIGTVKNNPMSVAIKKMHRPELDEVSGDLFIREIETLIISKHDFIVPFVGFTSTPPYCIVLKNIVNDSLFNAIRDDPKHLELTPTDLTLIAFGIAHGMEFLHKKNITHRDLKSENILIDENRLPVICDFGSSRRMAKNMELQTGEVGTPNYMAPEFIKAEGYTEKVDVYSYGMILWELITHELPFDGLAAPQVICAVMIHDKRPEMPKDAPEPLAELIRQCWDTDPNIRPSFTEIVKLFREQKICFQDCDLEIFAEKIAPFSGESKNYVPLQPKQPKKPPQPGIALYRPPPNSQGSSLYSSAQKFKTQSIGDTKQLLKAYLMNLGDGSAQGPAIDFLMEHADDPYLNTLQVWPPILSLLTITSSPSIMDSVQKLAIRFAKSKRRLAQIETVTDLHIYVAPQTLDLFLYIISFTKVVITVEIVNQFIKLTQSPEHRYRAIILLCKVLTLSRSDEAISAILAFFEEKAMENVQDRCGCYMLRALINFKKVDNDLISAYLSSSVPENCVAGYSSIFRKLSDPNLIKVSTLLTHITTDHDELRASAHEFVLSYATNVGGSILTQIIEALLTSVLRFSSEQAVLLLCRFAKDPVRGFALLQPEISSIWLTSSPPKAVCMMRVFSVLITQPEMRNKLINLREVPQFLSSVLCGDNPEAFLAVCWTIKMEGLDKSYLLRLHESENVTDAIIGWMCRTRDKRAITYSTEALLKLIPFSYSKAYENLVRHCLTLINEGNYAAEHCLHLLAVISKYKQSLDSFLDANFGAVLNRIPNTHSARAYQNKIFRHLNANGLNFS